MKSIARERLNEAIAKAGAKIGGLSLDDMDEFFLEKEKIIVSEMEGIGIIKGDPLFDLVRAEFCRIIRFCPN